MGYRTCPHCGANLDPGEQCDCQDGDKKSPAADQSLQDKCNYNTIIPN